ncbi:ABC transporter substrate-binding protein [Nocardioides sp. Bht2]|uniref:ABC transporter substrate-binding protein n=1 Tax=Nocardioides sp. Bht2 TaxID=3392297 RepID=UPI0039B645D8
MKQINRRISAAKALGAMVLAGSLALSACASSDTEGGGAKGDSTLVFGNWGGVIASFDPHKDGRTDSNLVLFPVYDRLIHQDPDGTLIPGLATEWEFTDDTTFTMKVREGVTFQDGTPLDAEAVKANIERAKSIDGGKGPHSGTLAPVESVEAKDGLTVVFHLSRPASALPILLSEQPGAMISPKAFDTDLNQHPVGAGAYTLTSYTPGSEAVFTAYDGYWDKESVGPKTIKVLMQADQERRIDAFQTGQLDATFGHTAALAKADRLGLKIEPQVAPGYFHLLLNRSRKPFDNVQVRQAMSYAINRQGLIDTLLEGKAEENQQPFRQTSEEFNDDLGTAVYAYDPAKARELLAEAGFGKGLSFTCVVSGGGGGFVSQFAELIQDNFKEVGIDMKIKLVDVPSNEMLAEKSADCGVMPYGTLSSEVAATQLFSENGYQNPGGTSTPELEALVAKVNTPLEGAEREAAYDELTEYVMDEALFINLFYHQWSVLSSDRVKGLKWYNGGQYTEFRGVEIK